MKTNFFLHFSVVTGQHFPQFCKLGLDILLKAIAITGIRHNLGEKGWGCQQTRVTANIPHQAKDPLFFGYILLSKPLSDSEQIENKLYNEI